MSYVVNTDTVEFYRGRQYHAGGVAVSVCGIPTLGAPEDTHIQRELLLGSRTTARSGHRRISGRNQHHPPPRPPATFDQFTLRSADSSIRRLAGHGGAGEELRREILDSDDLVVVDDAPSPHARRVGVLPRRFLVQQCSFAARPLVTFARCLASRPSPTGHCALRASEFGGAAFTVSAVRQVVGGAGGGRGGGHSPVDADPACSGRRGFAGASDHERRVPVAEGIPVDTHRRRCGRQITGPHDRDRHLARQPQTPVSDREPADRVLHRRERVLPRLGDWLPAALHGVGMGEGLGVGAQCLLLGDLGTVPQPCVTCSGSGEHPRQLRERRRIPGALLVDGFVPEESALMPFGFERARSDCAGAQPIRVPHSLFHAKQYMESSNMLSVWKRPCRTTTSSIAAPTTSCGARNIGARFSAGGSSNDSSRSFGKSAPNETRPLSSWRRCPITCLSPPPAIRSSGYIDWSSRSRGAPCASCHQNSLRASLVCPLCGPTRTSSLLSAARPRKW